MGEGESWDNVCGDIAEHGNNNSKNWDTEGKKPGHVCVGGGTVMYAAAACTRLGVFRFSCSARWGPQKRRSGNVRDARQ